MSITKHTTSAFIIKYYESGENDLMYKIWTKDFGIIFALAKSVRKINAKLRMILRKNDFINITLVEGRELWRIVGTAEDENLNQNFEKDLNLNQEKKFLEIKKIISDGVDKFLEERKAYIYLFSLFKSIFDKENKNQILEISKMKILIFYIINVFAGYADFKLLNIQKIEELEKMEIKNFYLNFVLNQEEIKNHLIKAIKNSML